MEVFVTPRVTNLEAGGAAGPAGGHVEVFVTPRVTNLEAGGARSAEAGGPGAATWRFL